MQVDLGRQVERTLLSWRRTCLSVVVAGSVLVHLSLEDSGVAGLVTAVACVCFAAVTYVASARRHHAVRRSPAGEFPSAGPGLPCALLVAAMAALHLAALGLLLDLPW